MSAASCGLIRQPLLKSRFILPSLLPAPGTTKSEPCVPLLRRNYINDACGTDFTPGTGGPTPEESPEPEPVESPEPEPSQEPEPSPEPSLSPSIPDLPQVRAG